jgi:hypothetical protein
MAKAVKEASKSLADIKEETAVSEVCEDELEEND